MKVTVSLIVLFSLDCVLPFETNAINVRELCEKICSNPEWEFSFQEKSSVCLCWVKENVDEIDANLMQKEAASQGFTLWVVKNLQRQRIRRDANFTSISEESEIIKSVIPKPPVTQYPLAVEEGLKPTTTINLPDIKTRFRENEDKQVASSSTSKKYKSSDTHLESGKSKTDPVVGAKPKQIIDKLTPIHRQRQTTSPKCHPEILKLSLLNLKSHINRLSDRLDLPNVNCGAILSELEAVKSSVQQLIIRSSERRDHEKPRLIDQIKEREKERQTRIHSRFGRLDLPRRPYKLNLLGTTHSSDRDEKAIIITQPKELIDKRK